MDMLAERLEKYELTPSVECFVPLSRLRYEGLSALQFKEADWLINRLATNSWTAKKAGLLYAFPHYVSAWELSAGLLMTGADVRYTGREYIQQNRWTKLCEDIPWDCE